MLSEQGDAMTIWVDADAMPRAAKDILIRASQRRKVPVIMVANRYVDNQGAALVSWSSAPICPWLLGP